MERQSLNKINEIIIHTTASPRRGDTAADVHDWHINRDRPFDMCGYHFVIGDDGLWMPGRPMFLQGAHCSGKNRNTIGIAITGGKNEPPTEKQLTGDGFEYAGLAGLIYFVMHHAPNIDKISSHSDYDKGKPYCPGWDVNSFAKKYFPWANK